MPIFAETKTETESDAKIILRLTPKLGETDNNLRNIGKN